RWIISELQVTISSMRYAIESYRFDLATQNIYAFTWDKYCDWYLELSKPVLNNPEAVAAAKAGTRRTLVQVLEVLLRLAHPLIPFITEEIWQRIAPLAGVSGATIMLQPYPAVCSELDDPLATAEMNWVMRCIQGIRRIKGEMNIPLSRPVPIILVNTTEQEANWAITAKPYLDFLTHTKSITLLGANDPTPESAIALVGDMQILIPLAGLIDKAAELKRLNKELLRLRNDLERINAKLNNPSFIEKAPAAVVTKEQARLAEITLGVENLEAQAEKIKAL
ncbi:valyl-tRNA synthetase, partial [Achromatium sp. WMS2]